MEQGHMKLKRLTEATIALSITVALLLLLTSPLWIGWIMEHEHNKTRHAVADVVLQCPEGAVENREVWSKLGIAIFCEKEGIKHGTWEAWDGGYMHIAGEYSHGHKDGIWKYFNAHGEQWGTRTYAAGKEISALTNLLTADLLLFKKNERKLHLVKGAKTYRSYSISISAGSTGPKATPGNKHMPEGTYVLKSKIEDAEGRKTLHVAYSPDQELESSLQSENGFVVLGQSGILGWFRQRLGLVKWEDRSVAVSYQDMDEIWTLVEENTPIRVSL